MEITYESRYSDTEEFDKQGRWARVAKINGVQIAWINKVEVVGQTVFIVTCEFPTKKNSGTPRESVTRATEDGAKEFVKNTWDKFILSVTK